MSKLYAIVTMLVVSALFLSNNFTPPLGVTGAPGENTCANCHNPQNPNLDGNVTLTGMPSVITPNTAYVLTVTSTNPNGAAVKSGFELTILNDLNQQAGTITPSNNQSSVASSGGRQYWKQNMGGLVYPVSHMVTWTGTWVSPGMPANTSITYYIACNIANGNGSSSGDLIVPSTGGGMLNGGGTSLSISITSSTNPLCNGQNTGSAVALAVGGVIPYTYTWSNGGSGSTISNLAAGTYTVTVTDNSSATATANVIITQPSILLLTAPTITNVLCNGGSTGSITAHASGGVSPYSFDWSTGAGTATISNLSAGPYTVIVTDDNGCTKTSIYQVSQPQAIVINLVSLTHESCFGQDDGAISISVSGGVNPIIADWSNGFSGLTINNLAPGPYSVTVSDNNDCTKSSAFTINAGGIVNVNLNQQINVTCPGGANGSISVTASGGIAPYTYSWSNGSSSSSINSLVAGSYTVTASDNHGCEFVKVYTITQPLPLTIAIQQLSQNLCFGNSTADLTSVTTGGTSPYTSAWSNGVNGANNSNLPAGTYTLTVTDDHGCASSHASIIIDPAQVTVSVSTTDQTGVGLNNGTATANPGGGTGAFTYLWNNDSTTAMISGLPPGTYTVTVADANSCSVSGSAQVDSFGCSLDLQLGTDFTICEGDTSIILPFISGENGNVTYAWSDGSTGDSLLVLHTGEYCLTITDDGGCQDEDCIVVTEIIIPDLSGIITNESSPGAMNGSIQLDVHPGIATYLWNTGATTPSIIGLSPGVYCVTVFDVNGCSKSSCFNVQPGNCQLGINSVQTNVLCAGDSTGSITITAHNSTPPVTYIWSNGESTSGINNLASGNYIVTVSDATGCFVTDTFEITQPDALIITVDTVVNISDSGGGAIHVTITGGTGPYLLVWTLPDLSPLIGQEDLDDLHMEGTYFLWVTDENGCFLSSANISIISTVAVHQLEKYKSLKVYPIPAQDMLIVDSENEITEALITSIDGRLVRRFINPGKHQLDVSSLESGWYMIRIFDGQTWYIAGMVK